MLRVGVMVASSDVQQVCVQDDSGFLFQNDVPSVDDSDEAILASFCASGVTEKAGGKRQRLLQEAYLLA